MEIINQKEESFPFFEASLDGKHAGKMYYTVPSADRIIINHTEVHSDFKGKGVGKELFYAMINFANENKYSVIPRCNFTNEMFKKHPEFNDFL